MIQEVQTSKATQYRRQGYVVTRGESRLLRQFTHWCMHNQQPQVYVDLGTRKNASARVTMDLIFVPRQCNLTEESLELIRSVYDRVACSRSRTACGGVYNYITAVPREQAEDVARSYLAIYRWQNLGQPLVLPVIPEPGPENQFYTRLTAAKEQRYLLSSGVRDTALRFRWERYCEALGLPHLAVHEGRKGSAKVEALLPPGRNFSEAMTRIIDRFAEELELKRNALQVYKNSVHTFRAIPTDNAIYLVEGLARLLSREGSFEGEQVYQRGA